MSDQNQNTNESNVPAVTNTTSSNSTEGSTSAMNEVNATPDAAQVDELDFVTKLGKKLLAECDKFAGRNDALYTKYMLRCGKLFLRAKALINERKGNWAKYVADEIPEHSQSTVKHYTMLAVINNVEQYVIFGKQRLMWLLAVIDKNLEDPIGAFLTKHNIQFDPENNQEPKEFKKAIDVAISMGRIASSKITNVNVEYIKLLIDYNKPITNSLINTLVVIKSSGGDVNKHLEELCRNKGVQTSTGERITKMRHINELSKQVTAVVKTMGSNELIHHANRGMVEDAITHLNKVLALIDSKS